MHKFLGIAALTRILKSLLSPQQRRNTISNLTDAANTVANILDIISNHLKEKDDLINNHLNK